MPAESEPIAQSAEMPAAKPRCRRRSWRGAGRFLTNVFGLTILILASSEMVDACRKMIATPGGSGAGTIGDIATPLGQSAAEFGVDRPLSKDGADFTAAVLRATEGMPKIKQRLRDDLLQVVSGLIIELHATGPHTDRLEVLAQRFGKVIRALPVSDYQLKSVEFTLKPGVAYFLPGGRNSVALVGGADVDQPHAIVIRRNGRRVIMSVGSVRIFRQGAERCRLTLNEVGEGSMSATFNYDCAP